MNSQRSRFFSSDGSLRPSIRVARLLSKVFRTIFKKRKILIISDKKITSIPFTPSMQVCLTVVALVVTAWISYTGGKNLHYQEALDAKERTLHEKERQITITNLANKDLLSQVSDLHRDLKRLNTYFENISEYDERINGADRQANSKKKAGLDKNALLEPRQEEETLTRKDILKIRQTAHNTLGTINRGVLDRVKKLETVIAMTGLKLNSVTDVSYKMDNMPLQPNDHGGGVGGPYEAEDASKLGMDIPFDINTNLDANIDYLMHLEEVVNAMPLTYPIKGGARITSRFGTRMDPFRHQGAMHYGLDFAGPFNSRVSVTAPGRVIRAGRYGAYGNFVEVAHGNGITTRYGHLNRIFVHRGQKVQRGDLIGLQGNTGRSTGTHLHYEVRHNGNPYNPENFLKAGNYVNVLQENNG